MRYTSLTGKTRAWRLTTEQQDLISVNEIVHKEGKAQDLAEEAMSLEVQTFEQRYISFLGDKMSEEERMLMFCILLKQGRVPGKWNVLVAYVFMSWRTIKEKG